MLKSILSLGLLLFLFLATSIVSTKIFAQQYSTFYETNACQPNPCEAPNAFTNTCEFVEPGLTSRATRTGTFCCTNQTVGFGYTQCLNTNDWYAPDGSSSRFMGDLCTATPNTYRGFQCYTPAATPTPVPPTPTPTPIPPTPTPTPIPTYTITGNVFVDKNRNGARDPNGTDGIALVLSSFGS